MTRLRHLLLAIAALILLPGGGDPPGEVVLTPGAPPAKLEVVAVESGVLGVLVSRIENPAGIPFGVVLQTLDGREIGRFAVFPPDRTGKYILSLSDDEHARLARDGAVLALLDLEADAPELRVEVQIAATGR